MRGNRRVISAALAAASAGCSLTLAAATAGPAAAATAGGAARPAAAGQAAATAPVIIFLRSPLAGAASPVGRLAQIRAAQAPYLARLVRLGATGVHGYRLADAIAARVPASALAGLAASPGVASVIPDSTVTGPAAAS